MAAFADLAKAPPEFLPLLIRLLDDFDASPFTITFDRISERRAVTLRGGDGLAEAKQFQASVAEYLKEKRFPYFGNPFRPRILRSIIIGMA